MRVFSVLPLAGVSFLAMNVVLAAQEAPRKTPVMVLPLITLVANGQENIEATGGVVVTQEDITALQPADVSELFARDSSVSISGGTGPSKRIHVFGIEQSSLAVTVDGVPQFGDNWHHSGSNVIDPAFLKSVEIETGAAAADAGFGAAAGAVRYQTVGARDLLPEGQDHGGSVGLSYGSNGRGVSADLAGYGLHEGFDWFAMLHSAQGDDYENGDGYTIRGSDPAVTSALLKLGYEFETHRVEVSLEHSKDESDRVTRMNMDRGEDLNNLTVQRDTISFKYSETAPTAAWDPEVNFYLSRNDYARPDFNVGSAAGDMAMEAQAVGGVIKNRFEVGSGNITTGVDFAYEDYEIDNFETDGAPILDGDGADTGETVVRLHTIETMQVGAFAQGRFEFSNGIDLSTGLRVDHHRFTDWNGKRFTDTGASVNGTVAYEFAPGYEVFAGASRSWIGFDTGEYGYLHARGSFAKTSPDFEPATSTNAKLGVNVSQEDWTGNITYFDTRLKNLANAYDPDLMNVEEEYRSRGVTLQGNYSWGSGRFGASFTKADVTADGEDVLPAGGDVMPIGEVAALYVDQEIDAYNLKVGASLELAGRLEGEYLAESGFFDHAGYGVLNTYAEWRPERFDNVVLRLNVDNLLDKTYYERASYVQRGGDRVVNPVYAPGRTVTVGARMEF